VLQSSEQHRITNAGWTYRTNDRGWVIYRDPQTGTWHTQPEAISIVQARGPSGSGSLVSGIRSVLQNQCISEYEGLDCICG
jgi:hypothetical protein